MKKLFIYIMCLVATATLLNSCAQDPELPLPSALSGNGGVWAEVGSGQITLHWSPITDPDLYYIEVRYQIDGKSYVKTASQYSTEMLIDDLLGKYGPIEFEVQPFNRDGVGNAEILRVTAQAGAAPKKVTLSGKSQKVVLTEQSVWGDNPQEGTSYANLWDRNTSTVYHSQWNPDPTPMPHYLVVDMGEEAYAFAFSYTNRHSTDESNFANSITMYVSKSFDGTNFSTANCTQIDKITSGLPKVSDAEYDSKSYVAGDSFRYVWFEVNSTYGESDFFTFAELTMRELMATVYDPETGVTTPAKEPVETGEHLFKKLTIGNIYTNAQESSEGQVANFVDGNTSTFFHTSWSEEVEFPHYVVVDLGEKVEEFTFETVGRSGASTAQWKDLNIYVSSDYDSEEFFGVEATSGANFKAKVPTVATLVKSYTGLAYTAAPTVVKYDTISCPTPIRYVWFETTATTNGSTFMAFGELYMYKGYYGEPDPEYTFTINPTPADATVVINGEEQKTVRLVTGSNIEWTVSAAGYKDKTGSLTLTANTRIDVVLEAEAHEYVKLDLSLAAVYTNAQEPEEGPIAGMFDGNLSTFFHSPWSQEIGYPQYIVVDLGESVSTFKFETIARSNDTATWKDLNVYGSTTYDPNEFFGTGGCFAGADYASKVASTATLLASYTDLARVASPGVAKYGEIECSSPVRYIWFEALSDTGNWDAGDYFAFAEMYIYKAMSGGSSIGDVPYVEKGEE